MIQPKNKQRAPELRSARDHESNQAFWLELTNSVQPDINVRLLYAGTNFHREVVYWCHDSSGYYVKRQNSKGYARYGFARAKSNDEPPWQNGIFKWQRTIPSGLQRNAKCGATKGEASWWLPRTNSPHLIKAYKFQASKPKSQLRQGMGSLSQNAIRPNPSNGAVRKMRRVPRYLHQADLRSLFSRNAREYARLSEPKQRHLTSMLSRPMRQRVEGSQYLRGIPRTRIRLKSYQGGFGLALATHASGQIAGRRRKTVQQNLRT